MSQKFTWCPVSKRISIAPFGIVMLMVAWFPSILIDILPVIFQLCYFCPSSVVVAPLSTLIPQSHPYPRCPIFLPASTNHGQDHQHITDYWSSTTDHYDKYSLIINPQTTKSPPSLLTTASSNIHTSGGNVIFTCVNSVYNVHCNLHAFMQNFYTFVVIVGAASTSFCQLWQKAACDLLLPPPLVGPRQSDPTPRCKQGTWNKLI